MPHFLRCVDAVSHPGSPLVISRLHTHPSVASHLCNLPQIVGDLEGFFTPNAEPDVVALVDFLRENTVRRKEPLVVYGGTLEAFSVIQGALGVGVPSAQITVVTEGGDLGACIADPTVRRRVLENLQGIGRGSGWRARVCVCVCTCVCVCARVCVCVRVSVIGV